MLMIVTSWWYFKESHLSDTNNVGKASGCAKIAELAGFPVQSRNILQFSSYQVYHVMSRHDSVTFICSDRAHSFWRLVHTVHSTCKMRDPYKQAAGSVSIISKLYCVYNP